MIKSLPIRRKLALIIATSVGVGLLLTFMFLGNLVAALTLLPALSWLLLGGVGRRGGVAPGAVREGAP